MNRSESAYICLLYGPGNVVLRAENICRDDDRMAIHEAAAMVKRNGNARGYELWCAGRKIASRPDMQGGHGFIPGAQSPESLARLVH